MWDRLRPKEVTTPTLSRKKLEAWQAAHSQTSPRGSPRGIIGGNSQYQYAVKGGPTPSKNADDLLANAQQTQEQNSTAYLTPPTGHRIQRDSIHGRPTSSVYSQPSPEAAVFAANQLRNDIGRPDTLEVSPPSSPDITSPKEGPYPGDVSPIDEAMEAPQPFQERQAKTGPRSNIPMMRRERRKNSDALADSIRESRLRERTTPPRPYGHDVRWDPRTGEPTTSTKGRPSQVNPQEYAHGLTNRVVPAESSPPNPASLRNRLRPMRQGSASPQPEPAPRPEWRGASGRTAIVAPVRDNRNVAPLNMPPRSDKKADRSVPMLSPIESNGSEAASSPHQADTQTPTSHEHETSSTAKPGAPPSSRPSQSPNTTSNLHSSPVPSAHPTPLSTKVGQATQPLAQGPSTTTPSPLRPLQMPSNDKAIRRKPARASSGQYPDNSQSGPSPKASTATSREWAQPPSRLNTTPNQTFTPRIGVDDEKPPLSTTTQMITPTHSPKPIPELSMLDRRRPTIPGYEDSPRTTPTEPVKINLDSPFYTVSSTTKASKTPGSELRPPRGLIPEGNHSTLSVASVVTVDKSLPPAPPEASATDRVTGLNAQLEALGNRRININTAIRKLTEMMPTDNILASDAVVRKREMEKRKVETLRAELADVERQSYELGLKLHRAYKRLDRHAEFEPTTLWVRRVTG
ncbi:hypothetical protein F5B22DRAFT_647294 [Xylaria bambusicola]|uniref:uncharacterized protein n=1 Tax=Xylaria bambusicola TaxID=326684 RepID=UPI002008182D|nr:uncharacterized protein F5B22DRAFT_647294 [Xylaria bambusicola]KAI0514813.1 hypothetical protein F5B22DRAFT_647294 [Xylaria bambusicola]